MPRDQTFTLKHDWGGGAAAREDISAFDSANKFLSCACRLFLAAQSKQCRILLASAGLERALQLLSQCRRESLQSVRFASVAAWLPASSCATIQAAGCRKLEAQKALEVIACTNRLKSARLVGHELKGGEKEAISGFHRLDWRRRRRPWTANAHSRLSSTSSESPLGHLPIRPLLVSDYLLPVQCGRSGWQTLRNLPPNSILSNPLLASGHSRSRESLALQPTKRCTLK